MLYIRFVSSELYVKTVIILCFLVEEYTTLGNSNVSSIFLHDVGENMR